MAPQVLRAVCGLAEDRALDLVLSRSSHRSLPRPSCKPPLSFPFGKCLRLPGEVSRGRRPLAAGAAGQVTCGEAGRTRRSAVGGDSDPRGSPRTAAIREKLAGGPRALAGGLPLRLPRQIVKVSGFLGVRLSAVSNRVSPPRARGTGLGGTSRLYPQLFMASLSRLGRAVAHPAAGRPRPGAWVTLRAVPGTPSRAPGGSPPIPGFGSPGPRAESGTPDEGWLTGYVSHRTTFPGELENRLAFLPASPVFASQDVHGCFRPICVLRLIIRKKTLCPLLFFWKGHTGTGLRGVCVGAVLP